MYDIFVSAHFACPFTVRQLTRYVLHAAVGIRVDGDLFDILFQFLAVALSVTVRRVHP